jgi:nucleoside-diphosphate-sugar epimerase
MSGRPVVGVLGASGFIGSRVVEMFHLEGVARVRPIVHSAARLARSSRFALDGRIADGADRAALGAALEGCEVVVHAIAGDRRTYLGTLDPVYKAAEEVGVRRLIYLSSASVHGQAPAPGTDERSPLNLKQPIAYNTTRIMAERRLEALRRRGSVEVVTLRPGIVYGPRSRWTGGLADEVLNGQAVLVDGGRGICNGIYVDNLVHAIRLAMTADGADREAFLLGERETITWRDLYRPVVEALGFGLDQIPSVGGVRDLGGAAERVREQVRRSLPWLPPAARRSVRAFAAAWRLGRASAESAWIRPVEPFPAVALETTLLHRCSYQLPWSKARAILGYEPRISFLDACDRSVAWLAFAGYPVAGQTS